ncbi:hypothetical protein BC831DRAFT_444846 [Entophlyctis helioformis]|nr:hypothetical protein BC831DRAFT_444846 [Entophlyctis helioformis]
MPTVSTSATRSSRPNDAQARPTRFNSRSQPPSPPPPLPIIRMTEYRSNFTDCPIFILFDKEGFVVGWFPQPIKYKDDWDAIVQAARNGLKIANVDWQIIHRSTRVRTFIPNSGLETLVHRGNVAAWCSKCLKHFPKGPDAVRGHTRSKKCCGAAPISLPPLSQ